MTDRLKSLCGHGGICDGIPSLIFGLSVSLLLAPSSKTMGKLIKNHWARLIVLSAAAYQVLAALEGFFWPKILWDFLTKNLDPAVKPFPILQIINLVMAFMALAWEWPFQPLVKLLPGLHRSIEARLVVYPLSALAAILLYEATNAALYYIIGVIIYFWAFSEGEVCAIDSPP